MILIERIYLFNVRVSVRNHEIIFDIFDINQRITKIFLNIIHYQYFN